MKSPNLKLIWEIPSIVIHYKWFMWKIYNKRRNNVLTNFLHHSKLDFTLQTWWFHNWTYWMLFVSHVHTGLTLLIMKNEKQKYKKKKKKLQITKSCTFFSLFYDWIFFFCSLSGIVHVHILCNRNKMIHIRNHVADSFGGVSHCFTCI